MPIFEITGSTLESRISVWSRLFFRPYFPYFTVLLETSRLLYFDQPNIKNRIFAKLSTENWDLTLLLSKLWPLCFGSKSIFLVVYLFRVNIFQILKNDIPKVTLIPYVTFIKILGKFPMSRLIGPHAYSALESTRL